MKKYLKIKLNQLVKRLTAASVFTLLLPSMVHAQDVEDIRWKTESQVRAIHGEPNSIQGPIGTHATYTLWKYDGFSIAFSNNRAFHLFDKDSLTKVIELEEDRPY